MKKILIIEDDATLREELRLLLENGGYAPCVTTDFENAADEAARIRPDLVLPGHPFRIGCPCDYADKPQYGCR